MISKFNKDKKSVDIRIVLALILVLGIGLLIYDYYTTQKNFSGILQRNAAGEENSSQSLEIEFMNQNQEIDVEVSAKQLTDAQIEEAFSRAIREIDETCLGDNTSANEVADSLVLKENYSDGLVDVEWTFDVYGYISSDGKLNKDKIPKEGQLVTVSANLCCGDKERIYSFCVVVVPKGINTKEGLLNAIETAVRDKDKSTLDEDSLVLPTSVENVDITWKRKMDYRGLQIIILGFVCVLGASIGKQRDAKRLKAKELEEMDMDYPMIVSELSILMGAGMSFRKALERIVSKYSKSIAAGRSRARPGFEQMLLTYRRMSDGLSEIQAIEELGMKCESKNYRKLAMLLSQNLRKGSKDLIDCLEKEQQSVFEIRKQRAIRAGEEASTKLLLPMAGMLFIVIVILVVPAIMQINL